MIAYDVQFTEFTSEEDEFALLLAIDGADGKVVLATTEANERGESKILGGDAVLKEVGARPGNGVLLSDPGGVERRVPHTVDKLETLAVASAEVALGRQVSRDDFDARDDTAWIDYYGPPGTIESVSFSRVGPGQDAAGDVQGQVRGDRPVRAVAPGRPPHLDDRGRADGGGRDPGERDRHGAARAPAPVGAAAGSTSLLIVLLGHGRAGGEPAPLAAAARSRSRSGLAAVFIVAAQLAFNGGTIARRSSTRSARWCSPRSARSRCTT